jgi:probable rRNA maturation factor
MKLTIINNSGRAVPRQFLLDWVDQLDRRAVNQIKKLVSASGNASKFPVRAYRRKELIVVFVSLKEARRLNRTFRGRDYATDVLSFSSDEPNVLGELVICPQVIAKQAREHGLLVREELAYMVLHGFLHLLGFDHERSKPEERLMFKIQDRLFERLLS